MLIKAEHMHVGYEKACLLTESAHQLQGNYEEQNIKSNCFYTQKRRAGRPVKFTKDKAEQGNNELNEQQKFIKPGLISPLRKNGNAEKQSHKNSKNQPHTEMSVFKTVSQDDAYEADRQSDW